MQIIGPSASNFKSFSQSQEQFFFALRQNNFNTKYHLIMQLHIFLALLWLLPTRIAYLNWKLQSFSAITKPLKLCTHCCFFWLVHFFLSCELRRQIYTFFQKQNFSISCFWFSCRKGWRNLFLCCNLASWQNNILLENWFYMCHRFKRAWSSWPHDGGSWQISVFHMR